jgi:hypothetical protein
VLEADAVEDVRFNAAIGLARQGEARAYATLAEMLSLPDVPAAEVGDDAAQSRRYRRALVVVNALKGVGLLVDGGSPPPADVTAVLETLESDAVGDVRAAAGALARKLDRLSVRSP